MEIVVYDTNIIIDLYNIGLLSRVTACGWKIHTTRLVMNELQHPNREQVIEILPSLFIQEYDKIEDYSHLNDYINDIENKGNISMTDGSVLKLAQELSATLCTSDMKLRTVAMNRNIDVKGTFGLIHLMQMTRIITVDEALVAIDKLRATNRRISIDLYNAAKKKVEQIKQIHENALIEQWKIEEHKRHHQ